MALAQELFSSDVDDGGVNPSPPRRAGRVRRPVEKEGRLARMVREIRDIEDQIVAKLAATSRHLSQLEARRIHLDAGFTSETEFEDRMLAVAPFLRAMREAVPPSASLLAAAPGSHPREPSDRARAQDEGADGRRADARSDALDRHRDARRRREGASEAVRHRRDADLRRVRLLVLRRVPGARARTEPGPLERRRPHRGRASHRVERERRQPARERLRRGDLLGEPPGRPARLRPCPRDRRRVGRVRAGALRRVRERRGVGHVRRADRRVRRVFVVGRRERRFIERPGRHSCRRRRRGRRGGARCAPVAHRRRGAPRSGGPA